MASSTWCGISWIGGGLILLAIAAGSDLWLAIPLVIVGLAEAVWGVMTLGQPRPRFPRMVIVASIAIVAAATILFFAGAIGIIPYAALFGLHWASALVVVWGYRGRTDAEPRTSPSTMRPGRFVLTLAAQAIIVAAITTPALANTEPGQSAVPHGQFHAH